ncbi:heparinase II/III family protein [Palleronia sp.]|uniref:heparinase II/III family protein n=1 Tax=Palleronia sp. TaxID=1940284 RepID=UPI0035C7BF85
MPPNDLTRLDRLLIWNDRRRQVEAEFLVRPGPRDTGRVHRGQKMLTGEFMFLGYSVDAPETPIWDLPIPEPAFEETLHAFGWLDDLAATGAGDRTARAWLDEWIARYGRGAGPGWRPDLLGRRVLRLIDHSGILMMGTRPRDRVARVSLRVQARQLARSWRRVRPGPRRFDALAGLLLATGTLAGLARYRAKALQALEAEITATVEPDGTLPTRNTEALARIFAQLVRIRTDLEVTEAPVPRFLTDALERIAPVIRTLRHTDGALPRFHGGGRGATGLVDQALAGSRVRPTLPADRAMGYMRLAHGRTTLLMDAAPPPEGAHSTDGHASTLAFELTSGRRPLIVNCGSGRTFGDRWRRAGRATPSHSTLTLAGLSSSRLGTDGVIVDAPRDVRVERRRSDLSTGLIAGHDGYVRSHGLTHVRQVYLDHDGRGVQGEDVIATIETEDEPILDAALDAAGGRLPFAIRFHLHPDVEAAFGTDGHSFDLALGSGERWVFRHTGNAALSLEPSVYLDVGELEPTPARQIVLSSTVADYATRVTWTLAKADQTPDAVRDLAHGDRPVLA